MTIIYKGEIVNFEVRLTSQNVLKASIMTLTLGIYYKELKTFCFPGSSFHGLSFHFSGAFLSLGEKHFSPTAILSLPLFSLARGLILKTNLGRLTFERQEKSTNNLLNQKGWTHYYQKAE